MQKDTSAPKKRFGPMGDVGFRARMVSGSRNLSFDGRVARLCVRNNPVCPASIPLTPFWIAVGRGDHKRCGRRRAG